MILSSQLYNGLVPLTFFAFLASGVTGTGIASAAVAKLRMSTSQDALLATCKTVSDMKTKAKEYTTLVNDKGMLLQHMLDIAASYQTYLTDEVQTELQIPFHFSFNY